MKIFAVAVAVAALFAVANALVVRQNCKKSANTPNATVIASLLNLHNQYRSEASASIGKLVWDEELAQIAQAWSDDLAARNAFEHNKNRKRCSTLKSIGENIYKAYGSRIDLLAPPHTAVTNWGEEKLNYDLSLKQCMAGKVCGHWTQVVWKDTTMVGCGVSYYKTDKWFTVLVVCNYDPPGNFNGRPPF